MSKYDNKITLGKGNSLKSKLFMSRDKVKRIENKFNYQR